MFDKLFSYDSIDYDYDGDQVIFNDITLEQRIGEYASGSTFDSITIDVVNGESILYGEDGSEVATFNVKAVLDNDSQSG